MNMPCSHAALMQAKSRFLLSPPAANIHEDAL